MKKKIIGKAMKENTFLLCVCLIFYVNTGQYAHSYAHMHSAYTHSCTVPLPELCPSKCTREKEEWDKPSEGPLGHASTNTFPPQAPDVRSDYIQHKVLGAIRAHGSIPKRLSPLFFVDMSICPHNGWLLLTLRTKNK